MVSTVNVNASAQQQLQAFRSARSEVRATTGGVFARLRERLRPGRNDTAKNQEAWNALKTTLRETHGLSGVLAMRTMSDAHLNGDPLTPARIKSVLTRVDAYDAAQRLVLVGTRKGADGTVAMRADPPSAAEVHKAVSDLRAACKKAIAANPGSDRELSPYVVIHSMIEGLPPSKIQGLSVHDELVPFKDNTAKNGNEGKFTAAGAAARRWDEARRFADFSDTKNYSAERATSDLSELDKSFVDFVNQQTLQRHLKRSQSHSEVTLTGRLGSGANATVYRAKNDKDEEVLFKPFVTQEKVVVNTPSATDRHPADPTWFVESVQFRVHGALSAARAVGSDRVAGLLKLKDLLVETKFAVTSFGFGITMAEAKGSILSGNTVENHRIIDNARPTLARLQMADWICGQRDRHVGNIAFSATGDGSAMAFDNDDSFMTATEAFRPAPNSLLAPPPVIDTEMKERLDGVTPEALRSALQGILGKDAVDAAVERLKIMKDRVDDGTIVVIKPDEWHMTVVTPNVPQPNELAVPEKGPYEPYGDAYRSASVALESPSSKGVLGIGRSYADLYHATIENRQLTAGWVEPT